MLNKNSNGRALAPLVGISWLTKSAVEVAALVQKTFNGGLDTENLTVISV